ncbi:MAG TPA: discoidin domain-containing protein [Planctomycetota bacterium]|nr:discoidin domain-containing protein [Planctomycetota bacterium]
MIRSLVPLCLALGTALAADAAEVALTGEPTVREGASTTCTVRRADAAGDRTIAWEAGAPRAVVTGATATTSHGGSPPTQACDGRLDTVWQNTGNSKNEGKDDAPSITFVFDRAYDLDGLRVANYVNPGHTFRSIREVRIEASSDGVTFAPIATKRLEPGRDGERSGRFEPVPVRIAGATAVRLAPMSNHGGKVFGVGQSMDGDWSNGSIVGLCEVEFLVAGAGADDLAPASGTVAMKAGETTATFAVATADDRRIEGDEVLSVRLLPGDGYAVGAASAHALRIVDDDRGPTVSVTATTAAADERGATAGVIAITRAGAGTAGALRVRYATATEIVPVIAAASDSHHHASPPQRACDGSPTTAWMNAGNALRESEGIDEPWIAFTFAEPRVLGVMRVANLAHRGHAFRSLREIEVLVAQDEDDFVSVATPTLASGPDDADLAPFQEFALGGVAARRVLLRVRSNHARAFGRGESAEGDYANGSITGVAEVEFLTGSTAGRADLREALTGEIVIPDGAASVDLRLTPVDDQVQEGAETVVVTLLADDESYLVDPGSARATVTIADDD